ncbi:MAG: hypothetical protein ACYCOU_18150 [Sulfobacillus sp.]
MERIPSPQEVEELRRYQEPCVRLRKGMIDALKVKWGVTANMSKYDDADPCLAPERGVLVDEFRKSGYQVSFDPERTTGNMYVINFDHGQRNIRVAVQMKPIFGIPEE